MKPILASILLLLPFFASSQRDYTYVSDRVFFNQEMLMGYDFRPYQVEIPDKTDRNLSPGEYSFGVTRTHLYVEGPEIKGVYQISSINPTEYGYILQTINARDARLSGHLKVILNQWSQAEAVIFRRSPDEAEMIFYLAVIPEKLRKSEAPFFTDWDEYVISHPDSLWGKSIRPFFRVHAESGVQERLQMADSTTISFQEVITIEEKTKQVASTDSLATSDSTIVIKSKEIREYFVVVRSILQYDDGTKEDKTEKFQIKKVVEREFKTPRMNEERFEWELATAKGDPVFLYLNARYAVASIKIDGKVYQVRGY
ncbi:MAG: hypothetical protein IPG32_01010 [Saprospirales bacterium]|nr:hypothetical protein [Saprospirales bacterium]